MIGMKPRDRLVVRWFWLTMVIPGVLLQLSKRIMGRGSVFHEAFVPVVLAGGLVSLVTLLGYTFVIGPWLNLREENRK